jgi:hypothetical protein
MLCLELTFMIRFNKNKYGDKKPPAALLGVKEKRG